MATQHIKRNSKFRRRDNSRHKPEHRTKPSNPRDSISGGSLLALVIFLGGVLWWLS